MRGLLVGAGWRGMRSGIDCLRQGIAENEGLGGSLGERRL